MFEMKRFISRYMTIHVLPMDTPQIIDLSIHNAEGIKCIGRKQIAHDYRLSSSKAHRMLAASGITPVAFTNRHFYPEPEVRAYFERLSIAQK